MADIDVQAIGLASPPAEAYQTSYTPGVRVRNNGIADALVTGYLQMFDKASGVKLAQWQVSAGPVAPGLEATANAPQQIDLSDVEPGVQLLFAGVVTTQFDQVPANNPLNPVTVTVSEGVPPVPPVVAAHASQHETGGPDVLDVSNLRGKLYDPQPPEDHASRHEHGGADPLDVTGLSGVLASPQTPAAHANERHSVSFLSGSELSEHVNASSAHDEAANLEHVANKDLADGYAGLDEFGLILPARLGSGSGGSTKFLREDQQWADAAGTPGPLVLVGPDPAPQSGSSPAYARADHYHNSNSCLAFRTLDPNVLPAGLIDLPAWLPAEAYRVEQPFIFGQLAILPTASPTPVQVRAFIWARDGNAACTTLFDKTVPVPGTAEETEVNVLVEYVLYFLGWNPYAQFSGWLRVSHDGPVALHPSVSPNPIAMQLLPVTGQVLAPATGVTFHTEFGVLDSSWRCINARVMYEQTPAGM